MLHSTSAQAILEIVIFKTDRSNQTVLSSVKLLACSYDSCVTVGRGNLETPTAAVLQAIERLRQWWVIRMWKLRNCRRLFEPLPSAACFTRSAFPDEALLSLSDQAP